MRANRPPTRGYLRSTPEHECAGNLKPAVGPGKWECRICGAIHAPQWWGGPSEGGESA